MRLLIVDDEPAMHESYRRSFAAGGRDDRDQLSSMATDLFGEDNRDAVAVQARASFDCVHCTQGLAAVSAVENAIETGHPFAVVFLDIRMPPGIDGRETARRIRAIDPAVNIVIVTGFTDYAPGEIGVAAAPVDKLFYLAKPFEVAEIVQTATALSARWAADRELAASRDSLAQQVQLLREQSLELAANESRALHIATHDALTDAPNRLAFTRALAERARMPGLFAVGMIDLDRFKLVNDTLGHLAGDELIREIYGILHRSVPDGGLVARLGGDEFGILFDVDDDDAAVAACELVVRACAVTLSVLGHSVQGSASIGVVTAGEDKARDPTDLMRRSDLALNEAKRQGRNMTCRFDEAMDEGIRFRRSVENGLDEAIAKGELGLVYQPIVTRDQLEVVGFEALLRWNAIGYGNMSPAMFVPIAEESNLIHDLGDWVLDAALAELARWPNQYVSVNFSPRQFRRHDFVSGVEASCERAGVAPSRVQIEITESAIFDDAPRAAETLGQLRAMGFRIALDDFGTGYSSLYNIRKFALDVLKINRSFIDGMGRERESAAIVHSIIHLGRALGLGVIAKGVETSSQVQALRIAGASHLQGYFLSPPVDASEARALAKSRFMRLRDAALPDAAVPPALPVAVAAGTGSYR